MKPCMTANKKEEIDFPKSKQMKYEQSKELLESSKPDDAVQAYVENVEKSLREEKITHTKSDCSGELTLSIGYCNEPLTPDLEIKKLLELADQA